MREEMVAMAREAGCVEPSHPFNPWSVSQEALERFAALVVAAERELIVQECAEIAGGDVGHSILEHFGVE